MKRHFHKFYVNDYKIEFSRTSWSDTTMKWRLGLNTSLGIEDTHS